MNRKSHLPIWSLVQQDFQGLSEILKAVYPGKELLLNGTVQERPLLDLGAG